MSIFRQLSAGLFALSLSAAIVTAQQVPAALSSASKSRLAVLDELSHLPAGGWRYHVGDIPHGEAADLDDSSWKLISDHENVGMDAGWFRRTVEIPRDYHGYDLTGARIWFKFKFDWSGDRTQIIYFNGKRVAMGDDLEPVVLTEHAQPGEKILVAVKVLRGTSGKTARGADMEIDPPHDHPSPLSLRIEALTAARLYPLVPNAPSDALTEVDKAISSLDIASLDRHDQHAFEASLQTTHDQLMKFRPALQRISFYEIGNSHIDAAWLWPVSETIDVVKHTWFTALQLMNEYPDFKFTQSSAAYNSWMATKYDAINDDMKRRIADGRWDPVGGMWVEPDLNMPGGESLVRQILIGKRFFQHEYGVDVTVGWNPDSFGYNWQLPQIYKKAGINYFVTQKMSWSQTNQLPLKLFWWQSPDGSKVLSYFPGDYNHETLTPDRLADEFHLTAERNPGFTEMMDLYGIGDHGGGMTRQILDQGEHWRRPDVVAPKIIYATPREFFASVEGRLNPQSPVWNYKRIWNGYTAPISTAEKIAIPTWDDELYLENHRGVTTSHNEHKRNIRYGEEALLNAEKYASFAWLKGASYPTSAFEVSWQKLLFNQFHDTASGTAIHAVYKEAQDDFHSLFNQARIANDSSVPAMLADVNTIGAGVPIAVLNPLAWKRSGTVEIEARVPFSGDVHVEDGSGHVLPSQLVSRDAKNGTVHLLVRAQDVPSMGYTLLRVLIGARAQISDLKLHNWTLENSDLKAVIDPATGCITSLVEKSTNFETLASGVCGNEIQAFAERTPDAWNIEPGTLDHPQPVHNVDSIHVMENGPLRIRIEIQRTWRKSHITQEVVLDLNSPYLQFNNRVDWHERHTLLKAAFPLAVRSDHATYEIPFGTIARTTLRNNSWQKAQFEDAAIRWADLSDQQHGVSILNDSKYGYDAAGNVLRISLLRSPTSPDPEADQGEAIFSYAAFPHAADWKLAGSMKRGWEFDYPMVAIQQTLHSGFDAPSRSLIIVDADNVIVTSVKKAEDRDALVVRMFEWAGKDGSMRLHVPAGATRAWLCGLMEEGKGTSLPITSDAVSVPVHPFEIVTVQIEYAVKSALRLDDTGEAGGT